MRHRKVVPKLGRTASHRKATLRNLASAIIQHHQVKTTLTKAKAARSLVERLITYGKKNTVHARRLAFKHLQNRTLVKKLFDEIAPAFADRNGGYTRIIKLGQRPGDGAYMAMLQLVGFEELMVEEKPKAKKKAKPAKKEKAAEQEKAAEAAETPAPAETTEEKTASDTPAEPAAEKETQPAAEKKAAASSTRSKKKKTEESANKKGTQKSRKKKSENDSEK